MLFRFVPGQWQCYASCASLLMATALPALAQRPAYRTGYVVLAAAPNDTLRGAVDLRQTTRRQPRVLFRSKTKQPRTYALTELQAAGDLTGRQLRTCVVPGADAPVLLQVLVAGPTSLYQDPTGKLPAAYYLDKPGTGIIPLQKSQFAQALRTAFADCPTVDTQVAYMGNFVYSAEELRRYVVNYNRCLHPQTPVSAPPIMPAKDRLRWGVEIGAARVRHFYPYLTSRKASSGPLTPTGSAFVWVPLNNHLGLVGGFSLSSLRSDNTISQRVPGSSSEQVQRYQTRGALLRVPLSLRGLLRPSNAVWRPYLQLGGHLSRVMRGRMDWQSSYTSPNGPYPAQSAALFYGGIGYGFQAETGVAWRFGPGRFATGLRYEQTTGFPNTGRSYSLDFNQLSVVLNYSY